MPQGVNTLWTGKISKPMPVFHQHVKPGESWSSNNGGGENGVLPVGVNGSRPVLRVGLSNRPLMAFTYHDADADMGKPKDSVGVVAFRPSLDNWQPLGSDIMAIQPVNLRKIPRVGLGTSDKKVGLVYTTQKYKATQGGGTLHYVEYP